MFGSPRSTCDPVHSQSDALAGTKVWRRLGVQVVLVGTCMSHWPIMPLSHAAWDSDYSQAKCAHGPFTSSGNCSAGSGVGPRASKNIFARTTCHVLLPDSDHSRQVQPIATEHCSRQQQCWKLQQCIGRVQASLLTAVSCSAAGVVALRAAACRGGQHAGVPAHQPALG